MAFAETQDVASLQCRAKQSQSAGRTPFACETKPTGITGAVRSVPARAYFSREQASVTPCGVTTNEVDHVKQSQLSCRADGGHGPPHTSAVDSDKQSQCPAQGPSASVETQYLASPPAGAGTRASTTEPAPSSCQTKPTEADRSASRGSEMAFAETQDIASLQQRCDEQSQSGDRFPRRAKRSRRRQPGSLDRNDLRRVCHDLVVHPWWLPDGYSVELRVVCSYNPAFSKLLCMKG